MTIHIFLRYWTLPTVASRGFGYKILAFTLYILLIVILIWWANQTWCNESWHYSLLGFLHLLPLFAVFFIWLYVFFFLNIIVFTNLFNITFCLLLIQLINKILLYFLYQNLSLRQVIILRDLFLHLLWFLYLIIICCKFIQFHFKLILHVILLLLII